MALYRIDNNKSGVFLGIYQAETPRLALDAMARDAGYENYANLCFTLDWVEYDAISDLSVLEVREDRTNA
jgi:hypothetical protein